MLHESRLSAYCKPLPKTLKKAVLITFLLAAPLFLGEGVLQARALYITKLAAELSSGAIAAYAIGYTLFNLMLSFNVGFTMGLGVIANRKLGHKDYKGATISMVNGTYINFALAILFAALTLSMPYLLTLINEPKELIIQTVPFTNALSFALVPLAFVACAQQIAIISNRTDFVFILSIVTVFFICLFTYFLGIGYSNFPKLGLKGFGIAIFLAYCIELLIWILLLRLHKSFSVYSLRKEAMSLSFQEIKEIIRVGFPIGLKQVLGVNGLILAYGLLIGKISTLDLSVFQLIISYIAFATSFPNGLARITAVKVGRALGAYKLFPAKLFTYAGYLLAAGIVAAIGVGMFILPEELIGLVFKVSRRADIVVSVESIAILRYTGLLGVVGALMIMSYAVLAGFKDSAVAFGIEVSCMWLIALPVSYAAGDYMGMGVKGYLVGLFIGVSAAIAIFTVRIIYQFRKGVVKDD